MIILIVLISISTCFAEIKAVCELILNDNEIAHNIKEGNTRCILTTDVKWRVKILGDIEEAKRATYKTCLHLQYHRTCQVPEGFVCQKLDYNGITSKTFEYKCYTGMYYAEVESYLDDKVEENREYFYCLTPPVKSYSEPYNYPVNNKRPVSLGQILNLGSGDVITEPVVKFQIGGNDPDGNMFDGVLYWKIMTKWEEVRPVHTPNYNAPSERDQYKTYIPYSDTIIQEWDTRDNPSDIGEYELFVFAIDEHGRFGSGFQKTFYYHGDDTGGGGDDPVDMTPPDAPTNVTVSR